MHCLQRSFVCSHALHSLQLGKLDRFPIIMVSSLLAHILLFTCISLDVCSSSPCVVYSLADRLYCNTAHPTCSYVQPYKNLTLETSEQQLETLFNRVQSEVENGSLTQNCFEAFSLFYCHQVYTRCSDISSPAYSSLCKSDCLDVMLECDQLDWDFLTDLVLDSMAVVDLPSLPSNCSTDSNSADEKCRPLIAGNATVSEDCLPSTSSDSNTVLIIAISLSLGVPIALCTVLLLIMVLCCCGSSELNKGKDMEDAPESLEYVQPGYANQAPPDYHRNTLLMRPGNIRDAFLGLDNKVPTGTFARNLKTKDYLKMTPKQRLQALEFPHSSICIMKDQQETSFGPTYIGEATGLNENEPTTTVYIKSLQNEASEQVRQQFTAEMTRASGYNHPNVLSLLAVCNREEPRYMIFEHLEFGTLKHFLHTLDSAWMDFDEFLNEEASTAASTATPALGVDDLIGMGIQVAEGMDYLSGKGLVHKDLAARNCMVGQRFTVKIANFGLSYLPHSKDYCIVSSCSKTSPVPLRWLAPESLEHGKFSMHSDTWSFGILLWEIFTFGEHPYSDCSNAQVVKNVMHRSLLEVPENVPQAVHDLIHKCWHKTPAKRPLFSAVGRELDNALGTLDGMDLKKFGKIPSSSDLK